MESSGGSPSPVDQTWLAFSLSNQQQHYYPSPPPSQHPLYLCLFQHPLSGEVGQVEEVNNNVTSHQQQVHDHHDPSFLGGVGGFGLIPIAEAGGSSVGVVYEAVAEEKAMVRGSFLGGFSDKQQQEQQVAQQGDINKQVGGGVSGSSQSKKGCEGFGHRTSIYRGVTRHRWTGRYEAHLWDNSCRREGQSRKGRQVYLGGYDKEEKAARAYDLAALKYWGPTTTTNFALSDYEKELEEMKNMSRQEFVASLRRKSSGFSRGASMYRGVTRHHQHGRWQARIGRVAGNKDLYLGTFSTQEEAAEAYDIAAIKFRGLNAVTNFDISRYDVKSIISSNLPVGGMSKTKSVSDHAALADIKPLNCIKSDGQELVSALPLSSYQGTSASSLNFAIPIKPLTASQTYNLHALASLDHNEALGYSLGYVHEPVSGSSDTTHTSNASVRDGYRGYDGSNNESNASASGSGNTWMVTPSLHCPKANLSVLQTAIFGIE